MKTPEHFHQPWRDNDENGTIGDVLCGDIPIAQVQMQAPLRSGIAGNALRRALTKQIVSEHNALVGINPAAIAGVVEALGEMLNESFYGNSTGYYHVDRKAFLKVQQQYFAAALKPQTEPTA